MKIEKEHQIIMLPSESGVIMSEVGAYDTDMVLITELPEHLRTSDRPHNHLYIFSDEDLRKGDSIVVDIYPHGNPEWKLAKVVSVYESVIEVDLGWSTTQTKPLSVCKKIIATTDDLVYKAVGGKGTFEYNALLPQIPQHIIEAYVKKPFDKVMVEYESFNSHVVGVTRPKLNQDGTLAVSLVEEKMYSRKEVEELCRNSHLLGMKETLPGYPKPETIDEWIKENL